MSSMSLLYRSLAFILFFRLFSPTPGQTQTVNGILRQVFNNIIGTSIPDLTNNPAFPNSPSLETIESLFEAPPAYGDNYGTRMQGVLTAPTTGNYIFWIASDDSGRLYLSTDETPLNKRLISAEPQWNGSRDWESFARRTNSTAIFPTMNPALPANRSDYAVGVVSLVAGQRYYIEALQKEGTGGDNLAVGWEIPGGVRERPIPASRLQPYGLGPPVISRQPINSTTAEGGSATFSVTLQRPVAATYQWLRDGTNISGATNDTFSVGPVFIPDNGARFHCFIQNPYGSTNSANAFLTVVADVIPPTLVSVGNLGHPQTIFAVFSEPVDSVSATTPSNYLINNGITVLRATLGADLRTVVLSTTPIPDNVTHTLFVSNVRDRAVTPNAVAPNSSRTFSLSFRPLDPGYLALPRESIGPSSRRHGVVISEVMFHPPTRADARDLEFIEIYNSQPWFEEIGGWRISGAIDYVFPSNTVIQARSYLVVAAKPDDLRAVFPTLNPLGPFLETNSLQNSSGTLRLRNARDAVLFEMTYQSDPPFPAAADGGGHSLVLARPSYGEAEARAWAASETAGGTPGTADGVNSSFRSILINELLAHTDPPDLDFIELFNYSTNAVDLSGAILTDNPATNRFVLPANSIIGPRGFLVFTETNLGFALSSGGETIFLKSPGGTRVIDAVKFEAQENAVPWGRYPDGAGFSRLAAKSPGTNNLALRAPIVVFHELMYDPVTSDPNDEFIELRNVTSNAVNLSGWRIRDGVSYNFPNNAIIPAGGFLVVAKNSAHLRSNYVQLNLTNTLGNFSGGLRNGGERLELTMPDQVVGTNSSGQLETNTIRIVVDEVAYRAGGRWDLYSAGGGSSLELRDPQSDRRLGPNWGDSDESGKSQWVTVQATGVMDHGWSEAYQLHVTLMGAGEALIDNVEVITPAGTNLISNSGFETGTAGWVFQGNHNQTSLENNEGYLSTRSLHLRAVGRGDTGANRVRTQLPFTIPSGTVVTLRARARWLKGNPNLLLRLRGNWMEAPGYLLTAKNLGSPGLPSILGVTNAGPAITDVRHDPPLPLASQPVLVMARVHDPDALGYLTLNYRIDPTGNYNVAVMTNNGAGLYSTLLPGQPAGTTVAFFIQAMDNAATPAGSTFPVLAPARECLIRWGDTAIPGTLGTYRMWITSNNVSRWRVEEKMSNNPKDITFIYGTNRVIYNAGGWFHGSPYHSPSYNSPVGNSCDYDLGFAADEPFLGDTDINLFRPGNGGGDSTAQTEIHGHWFGSQFGIPHLYHRPVFVYANGVRRDVVFHDAQQPNGDFINQWFPDDADGDLHKIQLGFEFGDTAYGNGEAGYAVVGANLNRYLTTGGVFKQARYRQTWALRSASVSQQNDYTNLFALVNAAMTTAPVGSDAYTTTLTAATDVEEWFKVHVTQHLYNNTDSFSYGGGQNAFAYKPQSDAWKLFLWDIDFAFGGNAADTNLMNIGGADHGPRNTHPPFRRIYFQALIEAANGMLTAARSTPILDARYNGMVAAGAGVGTPANIKNFIATKRNVVLNLLAQNQFPFAITSNNGNDFTTNRNLLSLTGTAPLEVRTILINGISYPLTWTTVSNWVVRVPLLSGTNTLRVTGLDPRSNAVAGVDRTIRVNYSGANELAADKIVINEIMYNPLQANASYVELYNISTANAFDLSGWVFNGLGHTFTNGTIIEPGQFLVLAKDRFAFAEAFGNTIAVQGEFSGSLENGGETLTLVQPGVAGVAGQPDVVISQVTFDDNLPWPAEANGFGPSLQLIDALQDHNRVANWGVGSGLTRWTPGAANSIRSTRPAFPQVWLNEVLPHNVFTGTNGITDRFGDRDPWLELFNAGSSSFDLTGYFLANNYSNLNQWAFPAGAMIPAGGFLKVWLDGEATESIASELHANFRAATNMGSIVLSRGNALSNILDYFNYSIPAPGRSYGSYPDGAVSGRRIFAITTPGATNHPAFPPAEIRINEWMADNTGFLRDEADGSFEDWFELFNAGTNEVDLTGYFLSDTLTNTTQWEIPAGTILPAGGFLLVWADDDTEQNSGGDLHTSFALSRNGDAIGLFSPDGFLVDGVQFGAQTTNISQGRFPDGAVFIYSMTNPTPRLPNFIANPNNPPTLDLIGNRTVDEGAPLSFLVTANDSNQPPQNLTFSLLPGAPSGAAIDPTLGRFSWTPTELQGPGVYDVTFRVADNGTPSMSATQQIRITVQEANNQPFLQELLSVTLNEGATLQVTNVATDSDSPAQVLTYSLGTNAPAGMTIHPTSGVLQWTPGEADGPGNVTVTIVVTDNGSPLRNHSQDFTILVNEVNAPPQALFTTNHQVGVDATLIFTATASDSDLPAQQLTFALEPGAPAGAVIDAASGLFSWTPTVGQVGTNFFQVRITDSGSPSSAITVEVRVVVVPSNFVIGITPGANTVNLSFPTEVGRTYGVQFKDGLFDAWQTLGTNRVANGASLTISDDRSQPYRFYRVLKLP